ncbi:MAG: cupin domain-containing protein [Verrucomicrobia bacterium]|nr:cupin domain-containing protein [Verrucomicrobiota bacterium]
MKTYRREESTEVFRAGKSTGHLVATAEQADVVLLNLEPGAHIPAHALEVNVLFAVASGSATLTAGGESSELAAGDVAEVPPGERREWENTTGQPCRIFVVKQK